MRVLWLLACASVCFGQERRWTMQAETVSLGPGEQREWATPAVTPAPGHRLVLEWEARVEAPNPGGSMYFLDLRVNDQPLGPSLDRTRRRLLNKPLMTGRSTRPLPWHSVGAGWRIVYAPDFEVARASEYGAEAYRFVVDVTDLISTSSPNTFRFERLAGTNRNPLVLRGIALREERGQPMAMQPPAGRLASAEDCPIDVGETVTVRAADRRFELTTAVSRPGGGRYRIGGQATADDAAWERASQGEWAGRGFQVRRRIERRGARITISDTYTNTSETDLGWHLAYRLDLGPEPISTVYLGGNDDATVSQTHAAANPTIYLPLGALALGLVYEDDVLRAQARVEYSEQPQAVSIETERFALPPGGSYTTSIALYVLPGGDYFDFINQVRRDWGVRHTIDGPIVWGWHPEAINPLTDEELRAAIARLGIRQFVTDGGWTDRTIAEPKPRQIGFGTGVLAPYFASKRDRMRAAADKIRRCGPGAKVLYYNHSFFNEPEAEPEAFADSWITGPDGRRFVNSWGGDYTPSGGVYPTRDNRFGAAWAETIETLLRTGADGFYWDDSNHPTGLSDPVTYNRWDGHTALLDPATFAIRQKLGHLYLLSRDYKVWMAGEMAERGVPMLGNGEPVTMAENRLAWPRFVETHHALRRGLDSHLYTPIAYGATNLSIAEIRNRLAIGMLHYRVGLADRSDVLKYFYPITITDLHAGYVRGEERLVTMLSGVYGWPGQRVAARLRIYEADGTGRPALDLPPAAEHRVEVPDGGLAILERIGGDG